MIAGVTHIFPRSGSIAGGTRLTLFGQGELLANGSYHSVGSLDSIVS